MNATAAVPKPTLDTIPGPQLQPFSRFWLTNCQVCGEKGTWWIRLHAALHGTSANLRDVKYCAGGKAPTLDEDDGLLDRMLLGAKAVHTCAGVGEPHLHLTCRRCSHEVLMHTRD